MTRGGACLILFHKPGFGLDDAFRLLSAEEDLVVGRQKACDGVDELRVQHRDGPSLMIKCVTGPTAQRQAIHLGTGSHHVQALSQCDAFVAAWLPGTEGQGVADVLFGDYKPTGKLSFSWPRSMAQIPINLGDKDYDPLFKYGFGLTYG